MLSNVRSQSSHTYLPSAFVGGGPVCPDRKRPEHGAHSVDAPSGPGPLPEHSSALHMHQRHRQTPPSQKRRCEPRPRMSVNVRSQVPQRNSPRSFCCGIAFAPPRKRAPHAEHSVFSPFGPFALWFVCISVHAHHSHRHAFRPSQKRTWPKSPVRVSYAASHWSHCHRPSPEGRAVAFSANILKYWPFGRLRVIDGGNAPSAARFFSTLGGASSSMSSISKALILELRGDVQVLAVGPWRRRSRRQRRREQRSVLRPMRASMTRRGRQSSAQVALGILNFPCTDSYCRNPRRD